MTFIIKIKLNYKVQLYTFAVMKTACKHFIFLMVFAFITIAMHDWIFKDNLFVKNHKKQIETHSASTEIVHHNYSMQFSQTDDNLPAQRINDSCEYLVVNEIYYPSSFVAILLQPPKYR